MRERAVGCHSKKSIMRVRLLLILAHMCTAYAYTCALHILHVRVHAVMIICGMAAVLGSVAPSLIMAYSTISR